MKLNLENVPLFADVLPSDRENLAEAMRFQRVRQGERIFGVGDGSEGLYIVDIGWVKLLDADGMVVANLGPGNLFGETEVLAGKPREIQAVAATDMSMWVLSAGDLDRLVAESLDLGLVLSKTYGARIAQLTRYLAEERLQPVPFLYELEYGGLAEVANKLTLERYTRGSFLFHRGGWARALFLVESGQINLVLSDPGSAMETSTLKPGSVVGEVALLTGKPYTFTAEVESDAMVWALGRDDFENVCDRYPSIRLILSRSLTMATRFADGDAALEQLRTIPLFAELPESALKAVAQRLILRHVPAGELVYAEGSPGEAMYIVDSGEVEVAGSGGQGHEAAAHVHEGEYFGESALLTGRSRPSAVRAVVHTNLWALYRSDFDELMVRYPAVRQALNRTLGHELAEAGRRLDIVEGDLVASREQPAAAGAEPPPVVEQPLAPDGGARSRRSDDRRPRRDGYVDPSGWTGQTDAGRPSRDDRVLKDDTTPSAADLRRSEKKPSTDPLSTPARSGRMRDDNGTPAPDSPSSAASRTGRGGGYGREQKTEAFSTPPVVDPEVVPSRYRDEFVRPGPAGQRRADGTEAQPPVGTEGTVPGRSGQASALGGATPRSSLRRQDTIAADGILIGTSADVTAEPDAEQPRGPARLAVWFVNLTFQGKLRLGCLLLIFTWFVCIVPPFALIKVSNVSILDSVSALFSEEPIPASELAVADEPTVAEDPAVVNETVASPTDTPAPTNTPVPSPTVAPSDTPAPTSTAPPIATPTVAPTATPNNSGVVQAAVVWVRGGPSANFKALAKLGSGDKVSILGRNDDGAWVQVKMADGTEGWTEVKYIDTALKVDALALAESPDTPTPKATVAKAAQPAAQPSPTGPTETPTTAATPTPAIKYPAPVQTKPNDGDAVSNGPLAKNYLEWEPLTLEPDEFYNVTIVYKRNGADSYFGDSTTEPRYLLPEGLYGVADQHQYQWRVVVRKETSKNADNKPDGPAISPESGLMHFRWD